MFHYLPLLLLICAGMVAAVRLKKLTVAGAATGGAIGLLVYAGTGYTGVVLMALFFLLGTAATAWRKEDKIKAGVSHSQESKRTAAQVAANAGVAALSALFILFFPQYEVLGHLMLAASFSSATADTLSSEWGNVYGSRYFNITTFRRDKKGLDGVVSWEGTAAGVLGSVMIAMVYCGMQQASNFYFIIILLAGTVGNLSDSYMGALWERNGKLNNNTVNFANTLVAAFFAALLYIIL